MTTYKDIIEAFEIRLAPYEQNKNALSARMAENAQLMSDEYFRGYEVYIRLLSFKGFLEDLEGLEKSELIAKLETELSERLARVLTISVQSNPSFRTQMDMIANSEIVTFLISALIAMGVNISKLYLHLIRV